MRPTHILSLVVTVVCTSIVFHMINTSSTKQPKAEQPAKMQLHPTCKIHILENPAFTEIASLWGIDYGQYFTEVYLHNAIRNSRVYTPRAQDADFIFVANYASLHFSSCHEAGNPAFCKHDNLLAEFILQHPLWQANWGADFIFIATHVFGLHPNVEVGSKHVTRNMFVNSTMLLVDSYSWEGVFSLAKDFIIPYAVDHPPQFIFENLRKESGTVPRDIFIYFAGATDRYRIKDNKNVRLRLEEELQNFKEVEFNNPNLKGDHAFYVSVLQRSLFCLVVHGHVNSALRLFESIVAGCIPVIMADGIDLPFEGHPLIGDYRKFAVFLPEDMPGAEVVAALHAISQDEITTKQSQLNRVWKFFTAHRKFNEQESSLDIIIDLICSKASTIRAIKKRNSRY